LREVDRLHRHARSRGKAELRGGDFAAGHVTAMATSKPVDVRVTVTVRRTGAALAIRIVLVGAAMDHIHCAGKQLDGQRNRPATVPSAHLRARCRSARSDRPRSA